MDAVSELLAEVRAHGAVFRRAVMRPPWALRMASGAPLTLATMVRGRAWIVPDGQPPVAIGVGEVAVVRGAAPYVVADDPATAPTLVVTSADYCSGAGGEAPEGGSAGGSGAGAGGAAGGVSGRAPSGVPGVPGVADGGPGGAPNGGAAPASDGGSGPTSDDTPAVLLSGAFERRGELSERLLRALPPVLVVPLDDSPYPTVQTVADEIGKERPGQQLVLDRMLDLMLVSALRHWFDHPDADAPAWCRALDDPVVGPALRLLHDAPARPWTVAGLAAEVGVSRAALARRFTAAVGEPPMSYLAGWRVALATDLLRETDQTVAAIAKKVGYAHAFALSAAFKRLHGTRPSDHRSPSPTWRAR
ncbi:AraC family transcriptional regulator [Streptomyces sp. HSW2009]|uniref:AraC family transcriptional regulator n=1 Tax=Streptomyces sp. HSW2009 TaxID=3142890 RepID=UPI0032EBE97B